ncbi:hypothetical protein EPN90_02180 [Patescibacteria group bacterium]|nr:MAG: hypothetical protein EPN90_02180 [Patescibacteria group bacterium]
MPPRSTESRPPVTEEIDKGWELPAEEGEKAQEVTERAAAKTRAKRPKLEIVPPLEKLVERGKREVEKQKRMEEFAREAGEAVTEEARQRDLEIAVEQNKAKLLALSRELKTAKGAEKERIKVQMEALKKARDEAKIELQAIEQGVSVEAVRASREAEHEVMLEKAAGKVKELAADVHRTEKYQKLMKQLEGITASKDRAALKVFIKDLESESKTNAHGWQEAAKTLLAEIREEEFFVAGEKGVTVEEIRRTEAGEELAGEMEKMKEEAAKEVDERLNELEGQRVELVSNIAAKKKEVNEYLQVTSVGGFRRFVGRVFKGALPEAVRKANAELAALQADMKSVANEMNYLENYREEAVQEKVDVKIAASGRAALSPERALRKAVRTVASETSGGGRPPLGPGGELGGRG